MKNMNKIHEYLKQNVPWYQSWHEARFNQALHWVAFIAVAVLFTHFTYANIQAASNQISAGDNVSTSIYSQAFLHNNKKGEVLQDHILVKFKDKTDKSRRDQILKKHGLTEKSEIAAIKVKLVGIPDTDTPEEVVDRLNAQYGDDIEYAEVDAVVYPSYIPNDPSYGASWQLPKMSAESAWDTTKGNTNIIIAILDTGTDCTHEDLAAHCVPGWNTYDNNSDTTDQVGHGTATAGTAAAIGDNGVGIASPCFNCKIMPIRIVPTGSGSSSYSAIASALTYAADHGAKVANISFGPLGGVGGTVSSAASYFMSKGGVVVISAGNSSGNHPGADDPYMIMVSGVDESDNLYGWSDYGSDIDLAAAGCVTTTNNGGGYGGWCGTSFSSPTVAGVAGLIFSKNPSLTGYQVRDILKSNTNDIYSPGYDIYSGFGTPNMAKAVAAAGNGPVVDTTAPSAPTLNASAVSATQINLSWSPASDNVGVVGYNIFRGSTKIASVSGTSYSDKTVSSGLAYSYTVSAYDLAGNISTSSNVVGVSTPVQVTAVSIVSKQVSVKTTTTATITWTTNISSKGTVSYGSSSNSLNMTATDSLDGLTHTVTLTGLTKFTNYTYKISATSSDGSSTVTSATTSFKTDKR